MHAPSAGLALALGLLVAAACGPSNATGQGVATPLTDADAGAGAPSGKLCGCSLCQPVVSVDACSTDDDCAPSALCHAEACVAKAKAPQRTKDTTCTLSLMCATTDANQCGCLAGKCALSPRPAGK